MIKSHYLSSAGYTDSELFQAVSKLDSVFLNSDSYSLDEFYDDLIGVNRVYQNPTNSSDKDFFIVYVIKDPQKRITFILQANSLRTIKKLESEIRKFSELKIEEIK